MNIQPIVEGHGEVEAAPILLRRLIAEAAAFQIEVNRPIRKSQGELLREESLKRAVKLARIQKNCGAILILFESEDDCPAQLGPRLTNWANDEAGQVPCAVALAHREYEAWFLAAIESVRGRRGIRLDALSDPDPERVRDAKGAIERQMQEGHRYIETTDQPAFSALFDMQAAFGNCRSFRHLVCTVGRLLSAQGCAPVEWPPQGWRSAD
ncbi:MAG: DUF4276 family protein [Planctomycetes bacterium]|nr:DUF4276 family protein [Planctomycetota bacterium]